LRQKLDETRTVLRSAIVRIMDLFTDSRDKAIEAYCAAQTAGTLTLTDQLLYAILGQLEKVNTQLEELAPKEE
jgi:hypothetical protein